MIQPGQKTHPIALSPISNPEVIEPEKFLVQCSGRSLRLPIALRPIRSYPDKSITLNFFVILHNSFLEGI
jgi:hypothetical protein